ncbi:MAG: DNA-processing protein DprA [Myxococcota bacterium]|nr:DNA-processing protein DprA [Myxococcota bacterium]
MDTATDCLRPGDERPAARAALCDWLEIQRRYVFAPQRARHLLEQTADPRRLLSGGRSRGGVPATQRSVEQLARVGAVAVPFGSRAYPERLAELVDAPPLLLVRGRPELLCAPAVAIVGSRAATAYGRTTARRFALALARAGFVVVSGMATGVDGVAHAAALEAGGSTLAVLACGPDRVYPASHRNLSRRVVETGALVTEFPVGTPPRPAHFPLRNRIISALARAVLVVEARERSGSLVTARLAADQGVDVWAVPGPVDSPASAGTNRLLRDGAYVALDPGEMLEALGRPATAVAVPGSGPPDPVVSGLAGRVLASLRDTPQTPDALAHALGLAPAGLAPVLVELALAGHVAEERDGLLRCVSPLPE